MFSRVCDGDLWCLLAFSIVRFLLAKSAFLSTKTSHIHVSINLRGSHAPKLLSTYVHTSVAFLQSRGHTHHPKDTQWMCTYICLLDVCLSRTFWHTAAITSYALWIATSSPWDSTHKGSDCRMASTAVTSSALNWFLMHICSALWWTDSWRPSEQKLCTRSRESETGTWMRKSISSWEKQADTGLSYVSLFVHK